ncbi:MAG TPA: V-type ATP synthase subunit E [Nitrososphaerales archaeon]|nr:V-type ATP synthase subunit E [Nitrososphaerales archaeon]
MAAETLLREVEEKRKKALEELEADFATKSDEIRKRAENEKLRIQENAKRQATELSQRERIRIDGASKLQAKKLIFDATEKMLENNVAILRQELSDYAASKEYPTLLTKLVDYASKRLRGEIRVTCRQVDATALKKTGVEVAASNLNSIGGFRAERKDGTLELDLTFEEILRGREEEVRGSILSGE